ncbi:MAG: DUF4278 domain-containing protein [Xenococcaceae cyanobacterium MO_188.B29]|nr:DUF4278 domain-containing protein [Xenococcaceae cyanobacterium MO_188.B29]
MKLRFLGQVYSTSNNQVETIPSGYTACFLGQSYTLRRPIQTFKSQLGTRKYRGVAYGSK